MDLQIKEESKGRDHQTQGSVGGQRILSEEGDKSQIFVIKHAFVINFLCNSLYLFACFIHNLV